MNATEMVCHLAIVFSAVMGPVPIPRENRFPGGSALRLLALHSPLRWRPGYPTLPQFDVQKIGADGADFEQKRAEAAALAARFASCAAGSLPSEHPIFGAMTHEEWMIWGYRHTDHHLRQFGC